MALSLLAAFQSEAQPVGGRDLVTICEFTPWYYDLYVIWLAGTVLVSATIGLRIHRGSPRWLPTFLEDLFGLFKNREFSAIVDRTKSAPAFSFDSQFSNMAALGASPNPTAIQSAVRMADAHFRHSLDSLLKELSSLATIFGLTALVILAIGIIGIINLTREIAQMKVVSLHYISGGLEERPFLLLPGLLVLVFLYAVRRHLLKRIEERRIAWEYFMNRVMALEYMIGAEKEAGKASNQVCG